MPKAKRPQDQLSRRAPRARTPATVLAAAFRRRAAELRSRPLTNYQTDILGYARDRLRIDVLFPEQREVLLALQRGFEGTSQPRVAVRSGQKCGKTSTAIIASLWAYECFPEITVYICAAIIAQTDDVMWRELGVRLRHAAERGSVIEGKLGATAASGLTSLDGSRRVKGVSGREIEALAGRSGRQLIIVDEASHLPEGKAQVFSGNMMGGGSVLLFISNPTRNGGPFHAAFHDERAFWQTFHIDGEKVAAWQAETGNRIPYTTNVDTIREAAERYGTDSPFWYLRVKGEWLRHETGRAIPMVVIEAARARWDADQAPVRNGRLRIGYDPAGATADGDEHAWAFVRVQRCADIQRRRALTEDAAYDQTLEFLEMYREPVEELVPEIMIDAEGKIGAAIYYRLKAESERRAREDRTRLFYVREVRSSSKYVREPSKFRIVRDEMVWTLALWLKDGGAIPNDAKLQAECYAFEWYGTNGPQISASNKKEIRDKLGGRSCDSFDALALAVWRPSTMRVDVAPNASPTGPAPADPDFYQTPFYEQAPGQLEDQSLNDAWWPGG